MDSVAVGDKRYLQQIVNNLLSNAVKFTEKGTVRLRAEFGNERLSFEVEDTGIGIHEEDFGRIFTAFEQLENSPSESGFGLGLAIVSRLVSEMKGDIQVESKPGKVADLPSGYRYPLVLNRSGYKTNVYQTVCH